VGIPKEIFPLERRVAASPESVLRLIKPSANVAGFKVLVEDQAGALSYFANQDYEKAGAAIVSTQDVWKKSDIILKVRTVPLLLLCHAT
jgi:alanine dehydrogenase